MNLVDPLAARRKLTKLRRGFKASRAIPAALPMTAIRRVKLVVGYFVLRLTTRRTQETRATWPL